MIRVGVVGATGYTGVELLRILSAHPAVNLEVVTSNTEKGKTVAEVFPGLRSQSDLGFVGHDTEQLASCELVFFATPHATAMRHVPALLEKNCRVIDLSADFRLQDAEVWRQWYQVDHACPDLLDQAVYGLPELYRENIKTAQLVANPGCYPTAITLALLPAVDKGLIDNSGIIADAKSGVSGAGRKAAMATQFSEVSESFKAYSVSGHRHWPEIKQNLDSVLDESSIGLTFVPHLVPMNRGIHATVYVKPHDHNTDMQKVYTEYYKDEMFVDVMPLGSHPDTASVRGSNTCRIAVNTINNDSGTVVILSVIDNLVKGAAGQAVQNMNLMFGLDEGTGLMSTGLKP